MIDDSGPLLPAGMAPRPQRLDDHRPDTTQRGRHRPVRRPSHGRKHRTAPPYRHLSRVALKPGETHQPARCNAPVSALDAHTGNERWWVDTQAVAISPPTAPLGVLMAHQRSVPASPRHRGAPQRPRMDQVRPAVIAQHSDELGRVLCCRLPRARPVRQLLHEFMNAVVIQLQRISHNSASRRCSDKSASAVN